jgi:hypothetical protein
MSKKCNVSISRRCIQLEVTIPAENVSAFIDEFSLAFISPDTIRTTAVTAANDNPKRLSDWYVKVIVPGNEEKRFREFLKNFCERRGLKFKK